MKICGICGKRLGYKDNDDAIFMAIQAFERINQCTDAEMRDGDFARDLSIQMVALLKRKFYIRANYAG